MNGNVALPDYPNALTLSRDRVTVFTACQKCVGRFSRRLSRHYVRYMDWRHALRLLVSRLLLPLEPLLFDSIQLLTHAHRQVRHRGWNMSCIRTAVPLSTVHMYSKELLQS